MNALEQMPEKARDILLAAVLETGPAHRLIVAVDTLGGWMHIVSGNREWTVDHDAAPDYKAAIDCLRRHGLIIQVPKKGYYVTDTGYRVACDVQPHQRIQSNG